MKVAYISSVAFSDVDLSLLNRLQSKAEIDYYIQLYPNGLKGAAVNINCLFEGNGVFPHTIYPELDRISQKLNQTNVFAFNATKNRLLSLARIKAAIVLFNKLYKGQYDIIHCTWFPDFTLLWLLLVFRKRLVFTIHDPIPHSSLKSKTQLLYRWLTMKIGKHFILLNTAQTQEFIDYYRIDCNTQNIYYSKLGCYDYLGLYERGEIDTSRNKYILFFGKIFSYKGLKYLLPAMKIVNASYPNIKLIIAGSGQFDFDITEYKDQDYIEIRNRFIPEEELVELIRGSLFIVAPYIDATQSGVVMSAYAFGKPCIATNVGALPEVVKNMKNGLLVEPQNIDQLAEAIIYLIANESLIVQFSQNIKNEYSLGIMSWECIADGILSIYNQI